MLKEFAEALTKHGLVYKLEVAPKLIPRRIVEKVTKHFDSLQDAVVELGFSSEAEFHRMVSSVDIRTPEKMRNFLNWKENDGTKEGLAKLPTN